MLLVALMAAGRTIHADPGTSSLLRWVFDGPVLASARLGNTLYVGGSFTAVAPSATALPPVFVLSASGSLAWSASPYMDGDVLAMEPDGSGGYFFGGDFTVVAGLAQPYLAHVRADGSVDPVFRPALTGAVSALARSGETLFVEGGFAATALPPTRLGAVSTVDGGRLPWRVDLPSLIAVGGLLIADDRVVIWGTSYLPMITSGVVGAFDAGTGAELWLRAVSGGVQLYGSVHEVVRVADHVIVASNQGLTRLSLATGTIDPAWDPHVIAIALAVSGSTLYVGGTFTAVAGQLRQNLAAIDAGTAALLPWSAGGAPPISGITASSDGGVYVTGSFTTFTGVPRFGLARLDPAGALSPWVAEVRPNGVRAMREAPGGTLVVSSGLTATGYVTRRGLAAFDLSTGALLPWAPSLGSVRFLAAAGDRVWAGISGATFVFDATTGLDVDFLGYSAPLFADEQWIYRASWSPLTEALAIDRADLVTGVADSSWRPSVFVPEALAEQGDALYFASSVHGLAAVDRRTARVRWTNPAAVARFVTVSGDTLFTYNSFASGLESFDARTGAPIRNRIWNTPNVEGLALADGRLVPLGWPVPALVALDGQQLSWDVGLRRTLGGVGGHVSVAGDLLVLGGQFGRRPPGALQGLVAVPLDGQRALSDLRARPSGPATTFSWLPPTTAPAGGYVVEASTVAGTTQIAIPVGGSTSFAAEVPPGEFFVRVRTVGAPGGSEQVSNEIRVRGGCERMPAPPAGLAAQLGAGSVTLTWSAPDAIVTRYIVEAGSAPGLANLASIAWPGAQTSLTANAPPGTYHVRVRAANGCGTSAPSASVYFTIGATATLPGAPSELRYERFGIREMISWTPPAGEVTGYILEAGSDIGLANLLVTEVGPYPFFAIPPFTTPRGTYIVRVRAVNAAGVGPPSEDFVLRLQ